MLRTLDPPPVLKQDTKTFPKCYVGRNGKRNQQKLHIQVFGSLKTQRNQGPRLNVHTNQILAHTFIVMAPLIPLCLERATHLYV